MKVALNTINHKPCTIIWLSISLPFIFNVIIMWYHDLFALNDIINGVLHPLPVKGIYNLTTTSYWLVQCMFLSQRLKPQGFYNAQVRFFSTFLIFLIASKMSLSHHPLMVYASIINLYVQFLRWLVKIWLGCLVYGV